MINAFAQRLGEQDPPTLSNEDMALPKQKKYDQKAILQLFEKYNKKGDGSISFKQFTKMLAKIGVAPPKH